MKITWDWTIESELNRLMQSARNIGNGFYTLQHFYPLPYTNGQTYEPVGIYLPDLPYQHIAGFWQKSSQLDDHHLPIAVPPTLSKALLPRLLQLNLTTPDTIALQTRFSSIIKKVLTFLNTTFPTLSTPTHITIYPTYFGSTGSFNWITPKGEIVIYHRIDQGIRSLVECVFTSIIRPNAVTTHHATWSETEFLVDYLLSNSSLNTFIPPTPNYHPTLQLTRHSYPQLAQLSQTFLQKIGAPSSHSLVFSTKNGQIYFGDTPLSTLTSRESKIIQALLAKSPAPLTLDEIGDLIFTNEEKFSLAAINKTIERLRKKLDTLGISSSYLATASGVGYYLKN